MKNTKTISVLAAGAVLISAIVISSPESDFTLHPGFERRIEIGYLRDEKLEYDYQKNCNNKGITKITPTRNADHTAILTDDFDKSIIKVKVETSDNVNPWILIKAAGKNELICEQDDESDLTYFSSKDTEKIEADTYHVWVGDRKENNNLTKIRYTIEVTEEPNYY
ncbi:MAG: hypothetical protein F6K18_31405 [Okeania sp. SIO2C2]|uniref:hypothetical protein n=1 Tax=Okeania sp. SIO2C2 TaxID=2607787 RepID=UPI0013B74615|nr:hypothetical protein [Okeania sp. SIO2C2]NEP90959.1 hypothetical protein [Okeania sp. SIO2C2]